MKKQIQSILPQSLAAMPLQNAVSQAFIAYGGGKYSPLNQRVTVELSGVGIFGHHWAKGSVDLPPLPPIPLLWQEGQELGRIEENNDIETLYIFIFC